MRSGRGGLFLSSVWWVGEWAGCCCGESGWLTSCVVDKRDCIVQDVLDDDRDFGYCRGYMSSANARGGMRGVIVVCIYIFEFGMK
jgi:hypothetical protein